MLLYKNQQHLATEIVDQIEDFRMYEAPTGFGKTFVLLAAAVKLLQKTGKKVIISTSNNKLARDLITTAHNHDFGLGADGFNLIIGKSNYIDREKLNTIINEAELFNHITEESFLLWNEAHKSDTALFYDEFDDMIEYIDLGAKKYLHDAIVYNVRPEEMIDFSEGIISITNHFYLLYRAVVAKSLYLENYYVLIDEVHEIAACAENVFESSFSPFNLKNTSHRLSSLLEESDTEWKGKKTLLSSLSTTKSKMNNLISNVLGTSQNQIGEYLITGNDYNRYVDVIDHYHKSTYYAEATASLTKAITILTKNASKYNEILGWMYATKKEFAELDSVLNARAVKNGGLGIYLSPSKGYPTFKALREDPLTILHFQFWDKMIGFAGLSATLLVDIKTNDKSHMYAYLRLGIGPKKAKPIKQLHRVFPKENVEIHMPKENFVDPVSVEAADEVEVERWTTFVSSYIKEHFDNKNTLIIAGGYKEAALIALALGKILPKTIILNATSNIQTSTTIKEFERTGGILVGTRNYSVGISLEMEKLERLFILRLPYPVFTSKVWLDLKRKSPEYYWGKYNNEMLISMRQAFGRLQRTPKDTGEIHLMDSRIFSRKEGSSNKYTNAGLKRRIWHFAETYGIFSSVEAAPKPSCISADATIVTTNKSRDLSWLG
jgi:Rad3-related DNA helicase